MNGKLVQLTDEDRERIIVGDNIKVLTCSDPSCDCPGYSIAITDADGCIITVVQMNFESLQNMAQYIISITPPTEAPRGTPVH